MRRSEGHCGRYFLRQQRYYIEKKEWNDGNDLNQECCGSWCLGSAFNNFQRPEKVKVHSPPVWSCPPTHPPPSWRFQKLQHFDLLNRYQNMDQHLRKKTPKFIPCAIKPHTCTQFWIKRWPHVFCSLNPPRLISDLSCCFKLVLLTDIR